MKMKMMRLNKKKYLLIINDTNKIIINIYCISFKLNKLSGNIHHKTRNKQEGFDMSYTDNQKQLLLNCIKLINHGRYIASNETSTNQSPNISRSRSQIEIPNINVIFKKINKLNIG
jgi:hypothetical protein